MYELLDAAGATLCDPLLIILLAVMMMPSGGSSYVFSGKTDDVGFLLLKARAAARKLPCAHRRSAQGAQAFILNGGPPISYAEFFDLPARPDNITEAIWKDMSETAFDVIIGFIHDAKHQRLVMGCGRDGGKLLAKLRATGGSKRQQMQTLDGKLQALQLNVRGALKEYAVLDSACSHRHVFNT